MIRRLAALLAVTILVGWALADDPPPRLKKKVRPGDDVPPAKKDEPKPEEKPGDKSRLPDKPKVEDEPDKTPPEPEIDEQEVLNRLSKDLRTAEERLGNKDLGEGTKQVQRDILKGLEDLIKASQSSSQQDQQDQSGGAGQDQQQQQQQQAKGSPGKRNNQAKGQNQRAERQARRNQKQQQTAGKNRQQGNNQQQNDPQQQAANNPGGGAKGQDTEMNKIADVYKDIWGHLPETLRAEMNAYGREKFMLKYEDLIKRYYDRAARESRRKGD